MNAPDPFYDLRAALYRFAPGIVATREIDDALYAQYEANGFLPLSEAQVLAITGPLPAPLATLPKLPIGDQL